MINKSIETGILCLEELAVAGRPVGSRELARRLKLDHAKVHRTLSTLAALGMAQKTVDRKYCPGHGLHALAAYSLKGSRLLQTALPFLDEFRRDGFTVAIGILWREMVCFLLHARPRQELYAGIGTHDLVPLETSSAGIALLAFSEKSGASHSCTGELDATRTRGWARISFPDGTLSIGVPIGVPPVAALAVSKKNLDDAMENYTATRLREVAGAIARAI